MAIWNSTTEHVNAWFRNSDDTLSPFQLMSLLTNIFLKDIRMFGLSLTVDERKFKKYMYDALCTYYIANLRNLRVVGPTIIEKLPQNWTSHVEAIWNDYIFTWYLTDDYWDEFWENIDTLSWEYTVPYWREFIQSMLPEFLLRDVGLLIEDGILHETSDKRLVLPEDFDEIINE